MPRPLNERAAPIRTSAIVLRTVGRSDLRGPVTRLASRTNETRARSMVSRKYSLLSFGRLDQVRGPQFRSVPHAGRGGAHTEEFEVAP